MQPGDCGDDRLSFHADGITGPGRQPFHRSAACSVYRSFLYCADRTMMVHPVRMSGTVIGLPKLMSILR